MNFKGAIETLSDIAYNAGGADRYKITEACELAITALDKQIARKPVYIINEFDENWRKACPNCNSTLVERIFSYTKQCNLAGFCLYCGQKIDWGETKE